MENYETWIKLSNGRYVFIGYSKGLPQNEENVQTVQFTKSIKDFDYYVIYYINSKSTDFMKYRVR